MSKKGFAVVVLLLVAVIAILAVVFLVKTLRAPQGAQTIEPGQPIWFAPWVCTCRAWCANTLYIPPRGGFMVASIMRDNIADAQIDCLNTLSADCDAELSGTEIISCRQVQRGHTAPVDAVRYS